MNNTRTQNTKFNMIWGMINKLISVFMPFIVRTVLIYTLGISYVGINGLFSSILVVLSLADLGFANAIVYHMYKPLAKDDWNTVCQLLGFYRKIYNIIGTVILGAGLLCIPFLKYLIKGEYPSDINITIIYTVYLFNTVLSYFLFAYKKSLLIAAQQKRVVDNIDTILRFAISMVQIIALVTTHNFYVYVIFLPVCTLIENLWCAYAAKKRFPNVICKDELQPDLKADVIEKTKGLCIYKICGVTRNSLDNIFISMFLGVVSVGLYNNYYYIMFAVRSFVDVITTSMSASVGNSVATESIDRNHEMLNIFTFVYAWICGWCTICMLCLFQPFVTLWIGKENTLPFSVVIAICVYFYVWTAGDIRSQYADASGLWWKERNRSIVETIGNVILNYVFVQLWGIFGIVLATAISIFVIGIPWSTKIVFNNYFKGKSWIRYNLTQIIYMLVTIAISIITYKVCQLICLQGIVGLICKAVICVIIPNVCYVCCFYKTKIGKLSWTFLIQRIGY